MNHRTFLKNQASRRRVLQTGAALAAGAALPIAYRPALAQEAITLDYWNWWDVSRTELMDGIIAQFQTENPNIVVNNVPQTWDRRDEVVVTALSGDDPPEVIMATRQEIVNFADSGRIVPITKYVEADGLDLSAYYESEISSMWWNGELYSLPMPTAGGETGLTFYSKDMFTAAGLDPEKPPATWDELDAAAGALTKRTSDGAIDVLGVSIDFGASGFLANLYVNAGSLYSEDLKTVTFNSAEGVQTLEWMLDFTERHYGGYQNWLDWDNQFTEGQQPLLMGKVAYQYQNVSMFFHIESNAPDFNYGVGFRPYNSNNPNAKFQGVAGLTFGWGYIIPSGLDPAVEEAAYKFVRRITFDEAGACEFMKAQGRPSPLIACNEDPSFTERNPHWDKVQAALEADIPVGIIPPQTQVLALLTEYLELAAFGEMGAQEALDEAAGEAQALVDEYWSNAS
jgi:ABC-type glycerol-3-phosphate transport system substrate-binding protein